MVIIIKILSEQLRVHVENVGPHVEYILTKVARRLVRFNQPVKYISKEPTLKTKRPRSWK